jgi:tetratricopeptide (TPR) repeat protein
MAEAWASYERAGRIATTMAASFPEEHEVQGQAADVYRDLADFLDASGKSSDAVAWRDKAMTLARRAVEADPSSAGPQPALADAFRRRGITYQKCGRHVEAVADLRRAISLLEGLTNPSVGDQYNLACTLSALSGVPTDAGSDTRAAADAAMATLRRAVAAGWRDLTRLIADPGLAPIRSRPDFQLLVMDLAFPADPFAR